MIEMLLVGMLAAGAPAAPTQKADKVLVVKSERTLTLFSQDKIIRTYKVALGGTPVGAKERLGDHKTPEGRYIIDRRNPKSQFYKSLCRCSKIMSPLNCDETLSPCKDGDDESERVPTGESD